MKPSRKIRFNPKIGIFECNFPSLSRQWHRFFAPTKLQYFMHICQEQGETWEFVES